MTFQRDLVNTVNTLLKVSFRFLNYSLFKHKQTDLTVTMVAPDSLLHFELAGGATKKKRHAHTDKTIAS